MFVNFSITPEKCTALPCEMQSPFVRWKVYCFPPNVGGCEKASCVV